MKKSRFYYSPEAWKASVIVTTDSDGEQIVYPTMDKPMPMSRTTICGSLDTETNVLSFGVAVCSANDQFQRKIGREIAQNRALTCPLIKVSVTKGNISKVFIETAIALTQQISEMKNLTLNGNL